MADRYSQMQCSSWVSGIACTFGQCQFEEAQSCGGGASTLWEGREKCYGESYIQY